MKNQESQLQKSCVEWFRYQFSKYIIFAIPNGGHRNIIIAANLKKEGVLAGIPDLCVIFPNKIFFIEMKYGTNKPKGKQKELIELMNHYGARVYVCNSLESFQQIINNEHTEYRRVKT